MGVNVSGGPLEFDAIINMGDFERNLARMEAGLNRLSDTQKKQAQGVEDFAKRAAQAAAGFFSIQAASGFIKSMVDVRGEFQQIEIAFTTMLKSKDKADKLMAEAVRLAAVTPFGLKDVASGAKQLLAYGVEAGAVTRNLEMLGNVAAGVGSQLNDVVYLYGTLKASGRVTQMDINQFAGRGIPIYEELAKVMKISVDEVRNYVSAGKVGFPQIEKAFQNMTGPAGKFFNLMQEQSKSLTGQLSNLSDAWDNMLNDLGKANEGVFANGIDLANKLITNYQKIIDIVQLLIITYGAYRAALIVTTLTTTGATFAETLHYGWLVAKDKVLKLVTGSTAAAAAATAAYTAIIGALIAVTYALIQQQSAEEIAAEAVAKARDEGGRAAEKEKDKLQGLIDVIKSTTASKADQKQAYDELKAATNGAIDGYTQEQVAAGKADAAITKYVNTVRDAVVAESEYAAYKGLENKLDELSKKGIDAVGMWDKLAQSLKNTFAPNSQGLTTKQWWDGLFSGDAANNQIVAQQRKKMLDAQNKLAKDPAVKKKIEEAQKARNEAATGLKGKEYVDFNNVFAKNNIIGDFDQLLKLAPNKAALDKLKEAVNGSLDALAPGDKKIADYKAKIKRVDDVLAQYSSSKSAGKANKEVNERTKFLENLNKLESASLSKALTENEEAIKQIQLKYDEQRKQANKLKLGSGVIARIDKLEKRDTGNLKYEQETKTLQTELEKQKNLYTDYENERKEFGDDFANKRYASLLAKNKTYLERLEAEQKKLSEKPAAELTGPEQERFKMLNELLVQERRAVQQNEDAKLSDALQASQSINIRRIKLLDDYLKQKAIIEKITNDKERAERLKQLEDNYRMQIEGVTAEAYAKTDIYKKLSSDVLQLNRKELKARIETAEQLLAIDTKLTAKQKEELRELIEQAKNALDANAFENNTNALLQRKAWLEESLSTQQLTTEEFRKQNAELEGINAKLGKAAKTGKQEKVNLGNAFKGSFGGGLEGGLDAIFPGAGLIEEALQTVSKTFSKISSAANELASAFEGVNDDLAYTLGSIGELAGTISSVTGKLAEGDLLGAVVSGVSGLINMNKKVKQMNAAARKEVADFYANAIAGEREYQDMLRERALQTIRDNKTALSGIRDELKLRKEQSAAWAKESAEIMARLQGMQFIKDEQYVHGTWFRKAKVNKTMGSLAGKSFAELSQLLAQGKLEGDAKALVERLKELEQKGYDAEQAIKDLAAETAELLTGTTSSNLTDAFTQLFANGKPAAQDFADFFEETMQNAALNIFKNNVLAGMMEDFYKQFTDAATSGTGIDQTEFDALQKYFNDLSANASQLYEEFTKITGGNGLGNKSSSSTLKGAIQRELTESTASELTGLYRGTYDLQTRTYNLQLQMSINAGQQLALAQGSYDLLVKVEQNTYKFAVNSDRFATMEAALSVIAANTKPAATNSSRDMGIKP